MLFIIPNCIFPFGGTKIYFILILDPNRKEYIDFIAFKAALTPLSGQGRFVQKFSMNLKIPCPQFAPFRHMIIR